MKPGRRRLVTIATSIAIHAILLGLFVPSARTPQDPSPAPFTTLVSTPPPPLEPPPPPPVEEVFDDLDPFVADPRVTPPPEPESPPPSRPDERLVAVGSVDLPSSADLHLKLRRPIRPRPPTRLPDPPPVVRTTSVRAPVPTPVRRVAARLVRTSDAPAYPPSRLDRGEEGDVRLRVEVLPDGSPGRIEALTPRAHPDFERAAIRWARGLDYRPARVNGKAVPSWVRLPPIQFRIKSSN